MTHECGRFDAVEHSTSTGVTVPSPPPSPPPSQVRRDGAVDVDRRHHIRNRNRNRGRFDAVEQSTSTGVTIPVTVTVTVTVTVAGSTRWSSRRRPT